MKIATKAPSLKKIKFLCVFVPFTNKMALYDHEGTRGLAPLSILGQFPGKPGS